MNNDPNLKFLNRLICFILLLIILFIRIITDEIPNIFPPIFDTNVKHLSTITRCLDVIGETVVIADNPRFFGEVQGFLVTGLKELHLQVRLLTREEAFGIRLNVDPLVGAPCRNDSIICFWTSPCAKSPPFDGTYSWDIPSNPFYVNLEILVRSKKEGELLCLNDPQISNMIWHRGPTLDYLHGNVDILGPTGLALSPNVQYMKLRYYPGIAYYEMSPIESNFTKIYDVLFIGSRSNRRNIILTSISEIPGIKLKIVQDSIFGKEREEIVHQSRIVINLHYYEKNFETVRLFWLLSLGAFVIAEADIEINSRVMEEYDGSMVFSTYSNFVETVKKYLEPEMETERLKIATQGYEFIRRETPGVVLKPLLESAWGCKV
jgi:hypothetical protein